MPNPLIAPQDVVDATGRGGTADPGLLIACDAASDWVRTMCERSINEATSTVTLDGTGTDALLLPELPVTAAGTVLVNGGTVTDYALSDNGILFRGSAGVDPRPVWPLGRQNVQVTYTHGWADQDIPRDLRMVALSLATRLWLQGPVKQESVGAVSVTYGVNSTDLTSGEAAILRKYKRL